MDINSQIYKDFKEILLSELVPALGCTEPGSIAFTANNAVSLLGSKPEYMEVWCSSNMVKNVKSVVVPNSGGLRGIDAAAILGALATSETGEDASLEILNHVTDRDREEAKELLEKDFCVCHLQEDAPNLYVRALVKAGGHQAEVVVADGHTNITYKSLDGKTVYDAAEVKEEENVENPKDKLSVKAILEFADVLTEEDGAEIFDRQIEDNMAISDEGLRGNYGARVGKAFLESYGNTSVRARAVARAAAGSDARMNGCIMPVVINSGSGNQGITVSVPVVEYAKSMGVSREEMYRALAVSNLVSIHIKNHIGKLSAFCGAVSAACGSGAAVAYMDKADYRAISHTIANTLGNVGGIVCDGAKASCAAKIASSLEAAFLGYDMAKNDMYFWGGEGFIEEDIEETIDNMGKIGKYGMKGTDKQIINLMLGNKEYICD